MAGHDITAALLLLAWSSIPPESRGAPSPLPVEAATRVTSFVADARLGGRNLFNLDFERAPGEPRHGTVWLATSDGLVRYDGYRWERFGAANGLPSDFVRCVLVNPDGTLWVGTDRGAGLFDGASFDRRGADTGLAGANVRRIIAGPDGTIWFCSDSWPDASSRGGLTAYRDGVWQRFRREDGLVSEYVLNFVQARDGERFAVTLDGVSRWDGTRWMRAFEAERVPHLNWSSAGFAESATDGLVVATGRLIYRRNGAAWTRLPIDGNHQYGLCATSDGRIVSTLNVSSGVKRFATLAPDGWVAGSDPFDVDHDYVEDVREAPDGSIWAVGFDTLVRWDRHPAEWRQFENAAEPRFVDARGRVWFARYPTISTPGEAPLRWDETNGWLGLEPVCDHLVLDGAGDVWGVTPRGVHRWPGGDEPAPWHAADDLGLSTVLLGRAAATNQFWVAGRRTDRGVGVAWWDGRSWGQRAVPGIAPGFSLRGGAGSAEGLWLVATTPDSTQATVLLARRDRDQSWTVPTSSLGLFRFGMMEDRLGRAWIFGDGGLLRGGSGSESWQAVTNLPARVVFECLERDDELWVGCNAATGGRGALVRFRDGISTEFPAPLLFNLSPATSGELLAAGPGRFYVIPRGPDAVLESVNVPTGDLVGMIVGGTDTGYWVGAGQRVFQFRPSREAPDTRLSAAEEELIEGRAWNVVATAVPRFALAGSKPDLRFSWRLNGGEWSPPRAGPEHSVPTAGLNSGWHELEVRAHGFGSVVDASPARARLRVFPRPLQTRPWFGPAVAAVLVLISSLALVAIVARRRVAGYATQLEARVAERSAQLERDVARRMRVEASLSRLVMTAPGAICAFRLHADGRSAFEFATPALEAVVGLPLDALGKDASPAFERVPAQDRERLIRNLQRHGRALTMWNEVFRLEHPERGLVWIEGRATPEPSPDGSVLWHGFLVDVTARVQSEIELERQRSRMEGIVQGSLDGILSVDDALRVVVLNPAAERIFGRPASGLLGRSVEHLIPESLRQALEVDPVWAFASRVKDGAKPRPASGSGFTQGRREDGTEFPMEATWVRLAVDGQELVTLTFRDVTSLREAESARRGLESQLRQSQKMQAIGTLAGGIAHDFNNILAAILGNLDCLRYQVDASTEARECLDEIHRAGLRAKGLVQQILTFGRHQSTQRSAVGVKAIIDETYGLLRSTIPVTVRLEQEVEPGCPAVFGDAVQLQQILLNLCTNAWHAMDGHAGRIEIRARGVEFGSEDASAHGLPQAGRYVWISVIDTGRGMDAPTCERVFEPFFTTKPPGAGTGLGLSVVHGIVRSFHGAIRITSEVGVGTTFDIHLPAIDPVATPHMPSDLPLLRSGSGQHILYLDDERSLVHVATRMLQRLGYRATGVSDADEAIAAFQQAPDAFDAVITDLHLPRKSGLAVAVALREARPGLPVILTSGEVTDALREEAARLGISGFLPKPSSVEELAAVLREVLGGPESPPGQRRELGTN